MVENPVACRAVAPKEESDTKWCAGQRSAEWINGVVQGLTVLEYVATPVNTDGDDAAKADDGAKVGQGRRDTLACILARDESTRRHAH